MQMSAYLSFRGDCEAAFNFYKECFDAPAPEIFRYAGSPMAGQVPPDWQDKVMHGSVTVAGHVLMGADDPNRYEQPQGFSLSLHMKDIADAERIFHALAKGGTVVMPLEKTFWADRFGVLTDRFGIPWTINCGE
jgi:PhnB protein